MEIREGGGEVNFRKVESFQIYYESFISSFTYLSPSLYWPGLKTWQPIFLDTDIESQSDVFTLRGCLPLIWFSSWKCHSRDKVISKFDFHTKVALSEHDMGYGTQTEKGESKKLSMSKNGILIGT